MKVIDSQVHIWAENSVSVKNTHRAHALRVPELIEQMDIAGVDAAVLVPLIDDYSLQLEAAAAHPDRFAIMAKLPVNLRTSRGQLSGWRAQPGVLGVRQVFLHPEQLPWLSDGTADWFWEEAEEYGIPVMLYAPWGLDAIADIARRHPTLRLVLDHMCLPLDVKDEGIAAALDRVWPLADLPNVAVKVSALPAYSSEVYPYPGLHQHIRRAVDEFGPNRAFWGADFTRLECTYRQAVALFTEEAPLTPEERERVMGPALADWLGWAGMS